MEVQATVASIFFILLCWSSYVCSSHLSTFLEAEWPNHGGGLYNRREARNEHKINLNTATRFKTKWKAETGGEVSATPAIADGVVYFPTWNGEVFAVGKTDGSIIWQKNLSQLLHTDKAYVSRYTPVVHKKYLVVGLFVPALLLALDRRTGALIWSKLLDPSVVACLTASGTVYKSSYYVGISSRSEIIVEGPCCSFVGSFVKVHIETGTIKWQTKMLPDNGGKIGLYSGAAIWGSSPSIDTHRRLVYIATGNLYSAPPDVVACEEIETKKKVREVPDPCIQPDDHSESILALNLDSGKVVWSRHLGEYDTWNAACILGGTNCSAIAGPDADFGEMPLLLTVNIPVNGTIANKDIVLTGQKNGFVWALGRDDGHVVWLAVAGPGGSMGGSSWGLATDGERVFSNVINNEKRNFTLAPSKTVITYGGWVAINASTGNIIWSVGTLDKTCPLGPPTAANGVLLVTSLGNPDGSVLALDAKSSTVLKEYLITTASISGGVSISEGCMFVPEGSSPGTESVFPASKLGHFVRAMCID